MEQWRTAMAGSVQSRQKESGVRTTNPFRKFLTDYVMFCSDAGQMDLDMMDASLSGYAVTGEDHVSVESASFAAHWLMPILYLLMIDEDGIRAFLRETIDHEKQLNQMDASKRAAARKEVSGVRRLKHTKHMLVGCTVFTCDALQSFVAIVLKNKTALMGASLSRLAESSVSGQVPHRMEIGNILSEGMYLIRALNYDPVFYDALTKRLGAAQKKYGFQPV